MLKLLSPRMSDWPSIGLATTWRTSWSTARRKLIVQRRAYPWNFFLVRAFSVAYSLGVGFLLYRYLFKAHLSPSFIAYAQTSDYLAFLLLGAMVFLFLYGALLQVSRALITELREGTLDSLSLAPSSLLDYLLGTMLQQTLVSLVETSLLWLIALLFRLHLPQVNLPATLLAWLVALPGFFGMATLLGACMLYTRDSYILQNTTMLALEILGGFFFPVAYLPSALQLLSNLLPVTWSLAALRAAMMNGQSLPQIAPQLGIALLLGLVYSVLGVFLSFKAIRSVAERPL